MPHEPAALDDERALPEVVEDEGGEHDRAPRGPDRPRAEVPEVGVERLGTCDREHDRPQHEEAVHAVAREESDAPARVDGPQDRGVGRLLPDDVREPEPADRDEPDQHRRAEEAGDAGRAEPLHREEAREERDRDRHHERLEGVGRDRETLDGGEHRDRGRDHAVAVEERGPQDAEGGERARTAARALGRGGDGGVARRRRSAVGRFRRRFSGAHRVGRRHAEEREQRQDPALALVVRSHDDGEILDRHHQRERPEDEREHADDLLGAHRDALPRDEVDALRERVERRRPDVAVDDAERPECRRRERSPHRHLSPRTSDAHEPRRSRRLGSDRSHRSVYRPFRPRSPAVRPATMETGDGVNSAPCFMMARSTMRRAKRARGSGARDATTTSRGHRRFMMARSTMRRAKRARGSGAPFRLCRNGARGASPSLNQISSWAPSSITRFGGILKYAVAGGALRARKAKTFFRQRTIPDRPDGSSVSRPRKKVVSSSFSERPFGRQSCRMSGTFGVSRKPKREMTRKKPWPSCSTSTRSGFGTSGWRTVRMDSSTTRSCSTLLCLKWWRRTGGMPSALDVMTT